VFNNNDFNNAHNFNLTTGSSNHGHTKIKQLEKLETVSIAYPLQNRQHAQTPDLDKIWHATVSRPVVYAYRLDFI